VLERVGGAGMLLRTLYEATEVRPVALPFHEQVDVVRHQAVRKNCKLLLTGGLTELQQCRRDDCFVAKCLTSFNCANREEISREPDV
jgi:hypothetical protein